MNPFETIASSDFKSNFYASKNKRKINSNPHIIIIREKIESAKKAIQHMHMNDVQQISLSLSHSHLYERSIHAESMAANIQGICAMAEVILRSTGYAIDGSTSDASSHRELLVQLSSSKKHRNKIIKPETSRDLSRIFNYRNKLIKSFSVKLIASDVFENVSHVETILPIVFVELEEFLISLETDAN